jgi:alpha-1,3-rhamnosyl/mannosyltransferase
VERAAVTHGVRDALSFLSYVPDADLKALYRSAVAQLYVSRYEGFGHPIVEAMAAGCPVVTSNRSSTAEIAKDAALLVDPEDHAQIADAIFQLLSHPEQRRDLCERGTERARRFSLERMAEGTLRVYERVMASRKH